MDLCDEIYPFPPGYYYDGEKFVCYHDATTVQKMRTDDFATAASTLREKSVEAVRQRLNSDAPVATCCLVAWTHPWSARLLPSFWASRFGPLQLGWTATRSTLSMRVRLPTIWELTIPNLS